MTVFIRKLTVPISASIQSAVDRLARLFCETFQVASLPTITTICRASDGRGGTYLVCRLQVMYPNGVFSNSEGCGPEPLSAIQGAFHRLSDHAPFCLGWFHRSAEPRWRNRT